MEQHKEHFVTDEVFKGKDLRDSSMMEVEEVPQKIKTSVQQSAPSTPPEKTTDEPVKLLDHSNEKPTSPATQKA